MQMRGREEQGYSQGKRAGDGDGLQEQDIRGHQARSMKVTLEVSLPMPSLESGATKVTSRRGAQGPDSILTIFVRSQHSKRSPLEA